MTSDSGGGASVDRPTITDSISEIVHQQRVNPTNIHTQDTYNVILYYPCRELLCIQQLVDNHNNEHRDKNGYKRPFSEPLYNVACACFKLGSILYTMCISAWSLTRLSYSLSNVPHPTWVYCHIHHCDAFQQLYVAQFFIVFIQQKWKQEKQEEGN